MLADGRKPQGKPDAEDFFYCQFEKFIQLLKESGFNKDFLKKDGGKLREIYNDLVKYMRDNRRSPRSAFGERVGG